MTPITSNPPVLPQHSQDLPPSELEDIELEPFPKYLPLRPEKRSFWRHGPVRIAVTIAAFIIAIVGTTSGAIFVGKMIQNSHFKNRTPLPIDTPKSIATVIVTQISVVTSRIEVPTLSLQSTVIMTEVVSVSIDLKKPIPIVTATLPFQTPCVANGIEKCEAGDDGKKDRVSASPGRQKPQK